MPVEFKDYYRTLGVSRTASPEEIRTAFRRLARQHHPDVAKDKVAAEARFKEINEAYEVLGDPDKRRRYDSLGSEWHETTRRRGPWSETAREQRQRESGGGFEFEFGGTGFSEFFERLFGTRRSSSSFGGGFGSAAEPERGNDVEADLLVSLEEALNGSVRPISVRVGLPCGRCKGSGVVMGRPCPRCQGSGHISNMENYQVKIPAGVREGQRLRVAGRGQAAPGGGPAGDLFLRVKLARHPEFQVEGDDLVHLLEIAPWEAVLGSERRIPTLEGSVGIRIPPGSQAGHRLRIRERGLPRDGGGRGDLLAELRIQVPHEVTPEQRRSWERLARESGFEARP